MFSQVNPPVSLDGLSENQLESVFRFVEFMVGVVAPKEHYSEDGTLVVEESQFVKLAQFVANQDKNFPWMPTRNNIWEILEVSGFCESMERHGIIVEDSQGPR